MSEWTAMQRWDPVLMLANAHLDWIVCKAATVSESCQTFHISVVPICKPLTFELEQGSASCSAACC